jgi:ubiquinone biosynthesis protein COQ4
MLATRALPHVFGKTSSSILFVKQHAAKKAAKLPLLLRHISAARSIGQEEEEAAPAAAPIPFYGAPRPPRKERCQSSASGRLGLLIQQAATALGDPTRADAVAAVGELTGHWALQDLRRAMQNHEVGRRLLRERPLVTKDNIPYEKLLSEARRDIVDSGSVRINPTDITFGQAYGLYLLQNGFDPDARDPIRYIDDPELAYIMLRYRQCHDFWHALTDLPPTVLGELGLKWLELFQTGLPSAALSSSVASFSLSLPEQQILWSVYLPWALRVGQQRMAFGTLMNIHYEQEWDTNLQELRDRYHIEPAPSYNPDL